MPIQARDILRRCVDVLQDTTSVRWPVSELVRYLNDGQREVILHRPDALSVNGTMTCVAGTRQTLPANGVKLIEVVRNTATGRAVRLVNREILDAQIPGWHNLPPKNEVLHYMYDPRSPRTFYVYPPANSGVQLDIIYSAYPTDIPEPSEGAQWSSVSGMISLPDIYSNVLQDYILYRAYTKDSEYAGNAQRAQMHYTAFINALGIEVKATIAVAPNPVGNPNQPHVQIQT